MSAYSRKQIASIDQEGILVFFHPDETEFLDLIKKERWSTAEKTFVYELIRRRLQQLNKWSDVPSLPKLGAWISKMVERWAVQTTIE